MNSFTEKRIKVEIILDSDTTTVFPSTGGNKLVIDGLRISAGISIAARQASTLSLNIWGMLESDMDALTVAWQTFGAIRQNKISVLTSNGPNDKYKLAFIGTIIEAQPDFLRAPDVSFQILAKICYYQQVSIADQLSFPGTVDIDVLGRYFAEKLELSYVNIGAKGTFTNPVYTGSVFDQLRDVGKAGNFDFYFAGEKLVFAPISISQPLTEIPSVVLTPFTGLIGYPMFSRQGLIVTAIYDPAFQCGSAIEIRESKVKGANGRWYPFSIELALTSNLPGGQWLATLQCNKGGN
jgi:hypothetical protein